MEPLESRKLLAATLGTEGSGESAVFGSDELHTVERLEVTSITLSINGESSSFAVDSIVPLQPGDHLELVEISYSTGQQLDGVLAVEAYASKLPEGDESSSLDYLDGRFGGGEKIAIGPGTYGGADGDWVVEEGWDRLTITLLRYFGDSSQIENISRLRLQVGQPDFAIDPAMVDAIIETDFVTGETVDFAGLWSNVGLGRYHNYLEIDVTHLDTDLIEWVGVSIANVDGDDVEGPVLNQNAADAFDLNWVPEVAGDYEILIAVDPENMWNESDETNNRVKLTISVNDPPSLRNIVFALDRTGQIATHNADTGETIVLGNAGEPLTDLALSPTRQLYGVSFTSLYSVDQETGQATLIGETGRDDLNSLAFLDDGTLIAAAATTEDLFEVDVLTGGLKSLGPTNYFAAGDVAVHEGNLMMSTRDGKLVEVTLEPGGVANVLETAKIKKDVYGLATTDSGLVASRGNRLYTVDSRGKLIQMTNLGAHDFSEIYGLTSITLATDS